jgi:3-oxoacyl-[acyl-carrier-protein] synthase-3
MKENIYLHSSVYRLGETRLHISDIDAYEARLKRLKIPLAPEVGLGNFCVTEDVYRLVQEAAAETVSLSGYQPSEIDSVVFCSSHFSHPFPRRNKGLASALLSNEIAPRSIRGICGLGCTDVLCGIDTAINTLELRSATKVLVIGLEAFTEQQLSARLLDYAIISDAVVTFIVSRSPGNSPLSRPLKIAASESIAILSNVGKGMNINDAKVYGRTASATLESAKLQSDDVKKVFGSNTFLLVKKARESSAGFSPEQMYLENVERLGHCLACDPIVNMIDYCVSGDPSNYILFAEAEGYASAVLLTGCFDYP